MTEKTRVREYGESRLKQSRRGYLKILTGTSSAITLGSLAGCLGGDGDGGSDGGDGGDGSDGGDGGDGGDGSDGGTTKEGPQLADSLNFISFGGSYGEALGNVYVDSFEDEYGVEVNQGTIGSDTDLLSRLRAGEGPDVFVMVDRNVPTFIDGDLVQPLRPDNIPNLEEFNDNFRPDSVPHQPDDAWYQVPHIYGSGSVTYHADEWPSSPPVGWNDLFTEETRGNISFPNWVNYTLGAAMFAAGVDVATLAEDMETKTAAGFDKIEEWNEYMGEWFETPSQQRELLATKESLGGLFFWGRHWNLVKNDPELEAEYMVPEEGAIMFIEGYGVAADREDPVRRTAELFIDHLITPGDELRPAFAEEIPYAAPYPVDNPPEGLANNPDLEAADRLTVFPPGPYKENLEQWDQEFLSIIRQ